MRAVYYSGQFRKDFKIAVKRGFDMELLHSLMKCIENGIPLDTKYKNHALVGNYSGHFECHIQPDWLLIYRFKKNMVVFVRTGSHSDLF